LIGEIHLRRSGGAIKGRFFQKKDGDEKDGASGPKQLGTKKKKVTQQPCKNDRTSKQRQPGQEKSIRPLLLLVRERMEENTTVRVGRGGQWIPATKEETPKDQRSYLRRGTDTLRGKRSLEIY